MARIVETHVEPIVSLVIQTLMTDGSVTSIKLHEDDMVNNLRYIEDGDIKSVTGKVRNLNYTRKNTNRVYNDIKKVRSYFSDDTTTEKIDIDCSKEFESVIVPVPTREIVENEGVLDVERMKYFLTYGAKFEIELTDNTTNSFEVFEGQEIIDLEYLDRGGISKVTGKLVAIDCGDDLIPDNLVLIANERIKIIPILAIKNIGSTVSPVELGMSVNDAIVNDTTGVVPLSMGTYVEEINVSKDITIKGAQAGVPATYGSTRTNKNNSLETVLSAKINVAENTSVTLDGVTLTETAALSLKNAKGVTLKNCRILSLEPATERSFVVLTNGTTPEKLVVKNCYFGSNVLSGTNKFYNLFEMNAPLADGSEISGNYFENFANTNNSICIYNVEDGATITIKNNTWERSANGIRVGVKGAPTCTINIENNTYLDTETDNPEWAGLVLVQPYGKETTSMAGVTININKTKHNDDLQLYYLYNGTNDMQFDETNMPTITVDGVVETNLPIRS